MLVAGAHHGSDHVCAPATCAIAILFGVLNLTDEIDNMIWATFAQIPLNCPMQVVEHLPLKRLIQQAYSAEKAAAFAYQGHAASLRDEEKKRVVRQIEMDEWHHRAVMLELMARYHFRPSVWYELRFAMVGKIISTACFVLGRFMPIYFAGRLESGNVCEYFRMIHMFHSLGITEHDRLLYDLGVKEKEHEAVFYDWVKNDPWLPFFEKTFGWGRHAQRNDVDLENLRPPSQSDAYCKNS